MGSKIQAVNWIDLSSVPPLLVVEASCWSNVSIKQVVLSGWPDLHICRSHKTTRNHISMLHIGNTTNSTNGWQQQSAIGKLPIMNPSMNHLTKADDTCRLCRHGGSDVRVSGCGCLLHSVRSIFSLLVVVVCWFFIAAHTHSVGAVLDADANKHGSTDCLFHTSRCDTALLP